MEWLKRFSRVAASEPPPDPPTPRIFEMWLQQDDELEDAKRRVARLMDEMEARNFRRTSP